MLRLRSREGQLEKLELVFGDYASDGGDGVHLEWATTPLVLGDTVHLGVVEFTTADTPIQPREDRDLVGRITMRWC